MNILIVDDDKYILQAVMDGIDWSSLPFENRYQARNGVEAKQILQELSVQVILCDIDMPGLSGLELLEWMRHQEIMAEAVFLTSFADFNYAQTAVRLGSFDYLLKPVEYAQLNEVLHRAAQKVAENEAVKQYGAYWLEYEKERKSAFWERIIDRREPYEEARLHQLKENYRVQYTNDHRFVLLALQTAFSRTSVDPEDGMFVYHITHALTESLKKRCGGQAFLEAIWKGAGGIWMLVLSVFKQLDTDDLRADLMDFWDKSKKQYKDISIYLSEAADIEGVYIQNARIRQMAFCHPFLQQRFFETKYLSSISTDF